MELSIPDMSCGHCSAAVTRAVQGLDPAARIEVDLAQRRVRLTTTADGVAVIDALARAGFDASPLQG